ncbi:hypothetical protein MUCCIDRAFT_79243 [Mucor lusitanicus CBS 277.49]|uniref:Uncharacterized protein n=1 Tax=Mucor lusitanicus CBS 277.49 TaxID=747725 RepID=A0A168LY06_MUCCL|nr:hypothetical protein MUCCIDRAFT_79243 [Mucor lusitanicus CBS 277.49]
MKRSNLAVCLLIVCASAAEIHQDFVDNVDSSQDEDKPTSGSINHPYAFVIQQPWHGIVNARIMYLTHHPMDGLLPLASAMAGSPPSGLRVDNENDVPNYSIAGIQSPLNSSNAAAAVQWHVSFSSFVQLFVALTTLTIMTTLIHAIG